MIIEYGLSEEAKAVIKRTYYKDVSLEKFNENMTKNFSCNFNDVFQGKSQRGGECVSIKNYKNEVIATFSCKLYTIQEISPQIYFKQEGSTIQVVRFAEIAQKHCPETKFVADFSLLYNLLSRGDYDALFYCLLGELSRCAQKNAIQQEKIFAITLLRMWRLHEEISKDAEAILKKMQQLSPELNQKIEHDELDKILKTQKERRWFFCPTSYNDTSDLILDLDNAKKHGFKHGDDNYHYFLNNGSFLCYTPLTSILE